MYTPAIPQKITVHRSNVRKDLIEIFTDHTTVDCFLDVEVIDPRGSQRQVKAKELYWTFYLIFGMNVLHR